ncbi:hypothetical protein ACFP1I_12380 [Dyadobacter subterraneus]|uniref:Uncharacterized protein n=1 Tax=Dyadobacter subterraneus TaxID=2773304 RepID=A0ABR9W971_9BACT|nr:hypothetical protein [Dyadobacter subterraneus]MBE9462026.1 hypothetical protein [Dyadobacter subterraneus]
MALIEVDSIYREVMDKVYENLPWCGPEFTEEGIKVIALFYGYFRSIYSFPTEKIGNDFFFNARKALNKLSEDIPIHIRKFHIKTGIAENRWVKVVILL